MISLQAYRVSVGIFQFKCSRFKPKNLTYAHKNGGKILENNRSKGDNLSFIIKIVLIFFLLGVNTNNNYSKVCQASNNRTSHTLNGNISKKGTLTLLTWNKGNSTFKNKRDDILVTLDRYKPDIFAIHEANYDLTTDRGFDGYTIEANTLYRGHQISRTIILTEMEAYYI